MKVHKGVGVQLHSFLISVLKNMSSQFHAPVAVLLDKEPPVSIGTCWASTTGLYILD